MWGDYGYIEDDLGKTYDLRLMRKLLAFARPYWLILVLTSVFILTATAMDLVFPYLTKIAVDRYIVVSAQKLTIQNDLEPKTRAALDRVQPLAISSGKDGLWLLPSVEAQKADPRDIALLQHHGLLRTDPFYLVERNSEPTQEIIKKHQDLFESFPSYWAIPMKDLETLDASERLKIRKADVSGLARIAWWCVLVLIIGYVFEVSQVILLEWTGQRITHDLRQKLMAHVLNQATAFHDGTPTGRLVARLTNDIQNLSEMIKSVAVTFFKDAFILSGIVAIMIYLNWKLALVTFILLPPIMVFTSIFRRLARDAFRELRVKVAQINSVFGETISGIRIIQVFRREAVNQERFDRLNHDNYLAGIRQIKVFAVFMPSIDLMAAAALGLIIWYGGRSVLNETMSLGVVVAFIGYSRKFFQPIRDLAEKFNILQSAMASLERIFQLLDRREYLAEPDHPFEIKTSGGAIEFDNVHFGYNSDHKVLKDLSLKVEPGQTLAIVGATGAGKTSIISLLLRFYDPNSGRILVDGQDIRMLDLKAHRGRIGLVMQDVFIFAGTVRENLTLNRAHVTPEAAEQAAEAVGATYFIRSLPNGFDQYLGEGGQSLSLGQRQLLAFARVLAQNPDILVLDEATAFIDTESEKLIETALARLTSGRTSIIIAHRLSTIRRADRILVLDHGRAVETGTHDQLMQAEGLYFRLHQLQFSENFLAKPSVE
jgi:ATP-binding cassette subfamily B multidrug efflux pump